MSLDEFYSETWKILRDGFEVAKPAIVISFPEKIDSMPRELIQKLTRVAGVDFDYATAVVQADDGLGCRFIFHRRDKAWERAWRRKKLKILLGTSQDRGVSQSS